MIEGGSQPGIKILKAARIFSPEKVLLLENDKSLYDAAIPSFSTVSEDEYKLYLELARKEVTNALPKDPVMFTAAFWIANSKSLPNLYALYKIYRAVSSSSADTERSFSKLKQILTSKRQSLMPGTLKQLVFLNWNLSILAGTDLSDGSSSESDDCVEMVE